MKKHFALLSVIMAFTMLLAACSGTASSSGASSASAAGQAKTLTIVHVNDVHGNVEETETSIGYPKIAAFIDKMKTEDPNTIALDAGDTFAGTPNAAFDKGQSIATVLNTIDFDAYTAGNNGFYLGKAPMEALAAALPYPTLAGNVVDGSGQNPWQRYTTIEMPNGLIVGIVSATCGSDPDLTFLDPVETLQRDVDEIRADVDVVVALLHLGLEDSSGNTSIKVANEVSGIDVIIDAHCHTVLEEGRIENGVLIAQTGEYGNNVGVVTLTIPADGTISAAARLVTREEMAGESEKEETAAALATLVEDANVYFAQAVGETAVELVGTRDIIRAQETNLGNFVADVIRDATGADVSIVKAGTIGGEIPAGEITKRDILAIARVSVTYEVFEITGAQLLQLINDGCKEYPEPSGSFSQVSGVSFVIDPSQPAEERVHSVKVGGEALDLEKTYRVAASAQAMGGLEVAPAQSGFAPSEVLIEDYIVQNSPINPQVEGRITEGAKP